MAACRCPGPRSVLDPHAPTCPLSASTVAAKRVVTDWFHEQWPGSPYDPHIDGDYGKLTKHIAKALAASEAARREGNGEIMLEKKAVVETAQALVACSLVNVRMSREFGIAFGRLRDAVLALKATPSPAGEVGTGAPDA